MAFFTLYLWLTFYSLDVTRSLVISKDITPQLIKILNFNESAEVTETCLELITNLAETGKSTLTSVFSFL